MDKKYLEIIKFAQELIKIKSQGVIDGEKNIAKAVFDKLVNFGFKPELIGDKLRPSVICRVEGGDKVIWLESCLDTVPAGDFSKWEYPPFEGKIVGNKMFGRGVADAKIGIANFCYLAKELVNDKKFNGSIFLGFDADEQAGNFSGIKEVIKHVPKADICILGYQGIDEISIGGRGWLRFKITTFGKTAHTGSRKNKGVNAIHTMGKIIVALTSLDFNLKTEPFFEFGSSLNVSQISGGTAINVVPDKCEALLEIRWLPSQTKEKILETIKFAIDNIGVQYELTELQCEPAYLTDSKNKFLRILKSNADEILEKRIPF
ncbi:MAG TPA: M20/M25/M40 family metallo-hydrolase, partial [Candidatus Pacearchaeota archaeon]|nr:M20/M25/M40 family metallo-hydrolase [Candidatus Pacearchaeota archaeon]